MADGTGRAIARRRIEAAHGGEDALDVGDGRPGGLDQGSPPFGQHHAATGRNEQPVAEVGPQLREGVAHR